MIVFKTKRMEQACNKLDVRQRLKIAEAVYDGRGNPITGRAAALFYAELCSLDKDELYEALEALRFEMTDKVIMDNISDEWFDE